MALVAAIVDWFDNGSGSSDLTALKVLVSEMWADEAPAENEDGDEVTRPYVVVWEVSETLETQGKDLSYRLDRCLIQFDTWHETRSTVNSVLEALENVYLRKVLSITGRTQTGYALKNSRQILKEDDDVWHGVLEVSYLLEKSPA